MVFETLGAINEEGQDVLRCLFRYAAKRLGLEFSSYCARAWARLSCTLQRMVSQSILTRIDGREFREPMPDAPAANASALIPTTVVFHTTPSTHTTSTTAPTATTTAHSTTVSVTTVTTTSLPSVRVLDRAPHNRQSSAQREKERTERDQREKDHHSASSSWRAREREEKRDVHLLSPCVSQEREQKRDICVLQESSPLLREIANTGANTQRPPQHPLPRTQTRTPPHHRVVNTPTQHHTLNTLAYASKSCSSMRGIVNGNGSSM